MCRSFTHSAFHTHMKMMHARWMGWMVLSRVPRARSFSASTSSGRNTPQPPWTKRNSSTEAETASSISVTDSTMMTGGPQQWDVDRYQDQHSYVWEYGTSLIDVARPQPGERLLDVGCGSGELTAKMVETAAALLEDDTGEPNNPVQAYGMDADVSMVERAALQFPNVTFYAGDIRTTALPGTDDTVDDKPMDLVFSNAALHWIPESDMDGAIQNIVEVLRPGGRLVVEFGGKGNIENIVRVCKEVWLEIHQGSDQESSVPDPWYFPSVSDFSSKLEQHGMEVTFAQLYDRPTVLQDAEEGLSNWIRMFAGHFLESLHTEYDIKLFLDKVNEKLRPILFDGEQWTADYRRIRIVATKQ